MLIFDQNRKFDEIVDFENEGILSYKNIFISDQEVRDIAKNYDEPPYINNIYYSEVISAAIYEYLEEYPFLDENNFFIYINGLDTHFNYTDNNREISFNILSDFKYFETVLEENNNIFQEINNQEYDGYLLYEIEEYFKDNEINITKENYDDSLDKCYDYLNEKFKFIDIPMETIENIVKENFDINLEENKKEKNKNMER